MTITLCQGSSFASDAGSTGAAFLKVPINGRAVALGGSFGAMTGDVTAVEYNPAGLCGLERTDLNATFIDHLEDSSFQAFSVGFPFALRTSPALDPVESHPFQKEKIYFGLQYRQFRGEDTARSVTGVKQENFVNRDILIQVAAAHPLTSRLGAGLAVKFIDQKLQDESLTNRAVDAGLIYKFTYRLRAGFSVLNIGSGKAFIAEKDDLPFMGRLAVAFEHGRFLLLADAAQGSDKVARKSAGVEWMLNRILKLRGGAFHDTNFQLTGGLGILFNGPKKAVAYVPRQARQRGQKQADFIPGQDQDTPAITTAVLQRMANKLASAYFGSPLALDSPVLAVFPLNSSEANAQSIVTDLLTHFFFQMKKFKMVEQTAVTRVLEEQKLQSSGAINSAEATQTGKILAAHILLLGNIDKIDEKYVISARLIDTQTGDILATDFQEISTDDFYQKPRHTLKTTGRSPSTGTRSGLSPNIEIGLDYGLQTHSDLGLTHTVSLRILY